eukprot:4011180-Prymnesium_polylepis.2
MYCKREVSKSAGRGEPAAAPTRCDYRRVAGAPGLLPGPDRAGGPDERRGPRPQRASARPDGRRDATIRGRGGDSPYVPCACAGLLAALASCLPRAGCLASHMLHNHSQVGTAFFAARPASPTVLRSHHGNEALIANEQPNSTWR